MKFNSTYVGIGLELAGFLAIVGAGVASLHHPGIVTALGLGALAILVGRKVRSGQTTL